MERDELKLTGLKMEYSFLCEIVLKRFEIRQKIIQLTLTLAAAFLGVALTRNVPPSVALVFPPIASLLEIEWYYLEKRQTQTIKYFKEVENKIPELNIGFENKLDLRVSSRFYIPAHCGIFLFSQLMALFIGILQFDSKANNWSFNNNLTFPFILFIFVDFVCIFVSILIIWLLRNLHNA
jgi:hypothetical protein